MTVSTIFIRELSAACRLYTAHSNGVRELSAICKRTGLSAAVVVEWASRLGLDIERPRQHSRRRRLTTTGSLLHT